MTTPRKATKEEIDFLRSLSNSELSSLLAELPIAEQTSILQQLINEPEPAKQDERQSQRELMAAKRAKERDLRIPLPKNVQRRIDCLANAELFLTTYFGSTFFQAFTPDRKAMLNSIIDAARYGGDYALAGPRGEGKALSLDTVLHRSDGTTVAMGDVSVGDSLVDMDGNPTQVTFATPVQKERKCYRVTLADGETVIADADHQWLVNRSSCGRRVVTTQQMADAGLSLSKGHRFTIPIASKIERPPVELPIDPYVFGCWLGDGSTNRNEFTTSDEDKGHFVGEFKRACLDCSGTSRRKKGAGCTTFTIGMGSSRSTAMRKKILAAVTEKGTYQELANRHGISAMTVHKGGKEGLRKTSLVVLLREIKALGTKSIPSIYFEGSAEQRTSLLAGLLDTDGSISKRGQVEFSNARRSLCEAVVRLAASIGERPGAISEKQIDGKTYYRTRFTARSQVFRLPRKAERVMFRVPRPKAVVSIEPVDSVPVRCIQVDSPTSTFLIGDRFTVTHNTRLAMYGAVYLMFAGLSPFPIVIGKSQTKSQNELKTIKERLQQNAELIADFPEVGVPFQSVGAWSSRARMQTVGGVSTNIEIAADHLIFPTITREQLPADWPDECEPTSQGQIMSSLGVDGPIRGTNFRDHRPTLAILDDIENKETAESDGTIEKNEDIIEKDVGGLGGSGRRVSRVMLCTTQNRKCIAYKYTDRKCKPSWKGRRFRKMITPPDRKDLWDEYIELRQARADDDPDARVAFRFYRDNQAEMDRGAEISNPYSYDRRDAEDGETIELSAIQAYYNRVADFGEEAVATEDDNDPPETVGPQGSGLTAGIVASRNSGLDRLQVPANTTCITYGIDLGKYRCHWVGIAWWKGAGGCIFDYGVADVYGTDESMDNDQSEPAIYRALVNWRDELLATKIVDAAGTERSINSVMVDSGTFTDSAYEFIRQVGGNFHVSKGVGGYKQPKANTNTIVANHLHASKQTEKGVWLWNLDTDYWKQWVHERFLTPTFDDENMLRRGSLSLFSPGPRKKHLTFAQHITAEEYVEEFVAGKGTKKYWYPHGKNNHWLDATYQAAAAAGGMGVEILSGPEIKIAAKAVDGGAKKKQKKRRPNHGRFKTRPGGWVQGQRRRT